MKKIIFIAGARPNFMKIAPVLREIKKNYVSSIKPILVHTGQHYDDKMSLSFFETLGIDKPDYNLEVGSGTHADQTAKVMTRLERVCIDTDPACVVVVGDVNSTIAAALVAKKLKIQLSHIEAGLRSGDREMPEEINRLATDAITDIFFVTEKSGLDNLLREGVDRDKIHYVGHVMIDNLFYQLGELERNGPSSAVMQIKKDLPDDYCCLTLHRPSNVDDYDVLSGLIATFSKISKYFPIVFPCHPRTSSNLKKYDLFERLSNDVILLDPLGYNDFLYLWKDAVFVMTDSGGIQEETTALGVPCVTLRENTERPITVEIGTNTLAGTDEKVIMDIIENITVGKYKRGAVPELWDGRASERICKVLVDKLE